MFFFILFCSKKIRHCILIIGVSTFSFCSSFRLTSIVTFHISNNSVQRFPSVYGHSIIWSFFLSNCLLGETESQSSLNLHFSDTEYSFMHIGYLFSSFVNCLFISLAHLLTGLLISLLFSFEGMLYI